MYFRVDCSGNFMNTAANIRSQNWNTELRQILFNYFFEMGFCYIVQSELKLHSPS